MLGILIIEVQLLFDSLVLISDSTRFTKDGSSKSKKLFLIKPDPDKKML